MGPCIYFSLLVSVFLCVICLHFLQIIFYTPPYGCIAISSAVFIVYCSLQSHVHVMNRSDSICSAGIHTSIQALRNEHASNSVLHHYSSLAQLRYSGVAGHVAWVRDWIWTSLPSHHLPCSEVVPFFHSSSHLC